MPFVSVTQQITSAILSPLKMSQSDKQCFNLMILNVTQEKT